MRLPLVELVLSSSLWLGWACAGRNAPSTELPNPSGPYNVGVSSHVIPFINEDDPVWPNNISTEFLATIYYPTKDRAAGQERYLYPELAQIYTDGWNVTDGVLERLTTSLNWNASYLEECAGPTLIFGPGGVGPPTPAYTILLSELASKGYVVASLDHIYEQPYLRLPNGTAIYGLPLDYPLTEDFLELLYEARLKETLHFADIWPEFVSQLCAPFAIENLGAFGHSFGGSLAVSAALQSDVIAAAINMDGSVWGDLVADDSTADVKKPVMFLSSTGHNSTTDASWGTFFKWQSGWWRQFEVEEASHIDYGDAAYWKYFGVGRPMGQIDGKRMIEITNVFVQAFFEKYLLGREAPVLDDPGKEWPEVRLAEQSD